MLKALTSLGVRSVGASVRGFASEAVPARKEVLYLLDNTEDPDVASAVSGYLKSLYTNAKAADKATPEESLEFTAKVEKKYYAAQVVEYGIQNIPVPLAHDKDGPATLKRYVSQLLTLGAKAGFEAPTVEVEKRIGEQAQTVETVKELLNRIKPYASADFFAALSEAAAAAEADTGSPVVCDGTTKGYKAFAEKVKQIAASHKIPVALLLEAKKPSAPEEIKAQYKAWLQASVAADVAAELAVLKAEAAALLDKHLAKTAEQVKAEQEASLASLVKKIDAAKGAPWAAAFHADLKAVQWYDAAVAADPVNGPRVSA